MQEYSVTDLIPGSNVGLGMIQAAKEPSEEPIYGENDSLSVDMEIEKKENRANYLIIECGEHIIGKSAPKDILK